MTYDEWTRGKETTADGYVQLFDQFRVTGDIDPEATKHGVVKFSWAGSLLPNYAFESEYAAKNGGTIPLTASVTADMTIFWLNDSGAVVKSEQGSNVKSSTAGHTVFESDKAFSIQVTEDTRTFRIALTIGGVGLRGGGFSLAGVGGAGRGAAAMGGEGSELALAPAGASRLRDSFFDIEVALPPGLTMIATDGHYMHQITIPEPTASFVLAHAAIVLTICGRRRYHRGRARSGRNAADPPLLEETK
jgi:hypothetical protein